MRDLLMGYFKCFFVVIFVSGCTSLPIKVTQQDLGKYDRVDISRINHWEIRGKLGLKSTTQGGSASIRWLQHNTNYKITLSGPFASGRTVITGDHQIAEMNSGGKTFRHTPQQLALQVTGLKLPVDLLSYWVKGLPSPNTKIPNNLLTNANGSIASFQQNNWQLSFSNYRLTDKGYLPQKIIGRQGEQTFKLVVAQWIFLDS